MGEGAVPCGVQAEGRTAQQFGIDRCREGEIERPSPGGRSPVSRAPCCPATTCSERRQDRDREKDPPTRDRVTPPSFAIRKTG